MSRKPTEIESRIFMWGFWTGATLTFVSMALGIALGFVL